MVAIKPLKWEQRHSGGFCTAEYGDYSYIAETCNGFYIITEYKGIYSVQRTKKIKIVEFASLAEAKQFAEQHHEKEIRKWVQ